MNKASGLARIMAELSYRGIATDHEMAHLEGDRLLLEAVRVLASGTKWAEVAGEIVERWLEIEPKWYA